jgi:hypothetical protein
MVGFAAGPVSKAPTGYKQHRTIGTLLNTLIAAGFSIRHINEWGPTDAEIAGQPALAEERERPMMMLVGVQLSLMNQRVATRNNRGNGSNTEPSANAG